MLKSLLSAAKKPRTLRSALCAAILASDDQCGASLHACALDVAQGQTLNKPIQN